MTVPHYNLPRMHRLLRDVPETVLILKPKRSRTSRLHEFSNSFSELVDSTDLAREGRLELIADDHDPYQAIAKCDAGDYAGGIPVLEKALTDARIPLPPRT